MPSSSQCSRSGKQTYVSLFNNCASNSIWNDFSADRKRVRRVIIVCLLGKDTRQQLRSLPHFVLNTVIMKDIVTTWPVDKTPGPPVLPALPPADPGRGLHLLLLLLLHRLQHLLLVHRRLHHHRHQQPKIESWGLDWKSYDKETCFFCGEKFLFL